jgi:hypothetical protein
MSVRLESWLYLVPRNALVFTYRKWNLTGDGALNERVGL